MYWPNLCIGKGDKKVSLNPFRYTASEKWKILEKPAKCCKQKLVFPEKEINLNEKGNHNTWLKWMNNVLVETSVNRFHCHDYKHDNTIRFFKHTNDFNTNIVEYRTDTNYNVVCGDCSSLASSVTLHAKPLKWEEYKINVLLYCISTQPDYQLGNGQWATSGHSSKKTASPHSNNSNNIFMRKKKQTQDQYFP